MEGNLTSKGDRKQYKYENENNKYNIELIINDVNNIHFIVINNENEYEIYDLKLGLTDLLKKSDFFQLCKKSEDFINYLNQLFENKNIIFEKNLESDSLIMKWKFNTLFKVEELLFNLTKRQVPIEAKLGLVSKNVENLKLEVRNIKKDELNKINEKINSLENKIKEIENNMKKEIKTQVENYLKQIKEKEIFFGQKSLILTNEKEINFITSLIRMIKPNSKLELIYRASADGQMGKDFHSKCDNIFPTISLFKTDTGRKFGGYTEANWNITTYGSDANAFIFSINNEKYYKVNNCPQKSIYCWPTRGPNFDGLYISEPFFGKGKFWETNGDNKCFPKMSAYEMSGKDDDNVLSELEVFKVIN